MGKGITSSVRGRAGLEGVEWGKEKELQNYTISSICDESSPYVESKKAAVICFCFSIVIARLSPARFG
jgi:hypothetical protein